MITLINQTRYKCEYCKKNYIRKHAVIAHEHLCFKNPENKRACFSCEHLEKKTVEIFHDDFRGGDVVQNVSIFHCSKLNHFLYPPKVEHKKNAFETDEIDNLPMKKECEFFKEEVSTFDDIFKNI